jgi:hypothetical protein
MLALAAKGRCVAMRSSASPPPSLTEHRSFFYLAGTQTRDPSANPFCLCSNSPATSATCSSGRRAPPRRSRWR